MFLSLAFIPPGTAAAAAKPFNGDDGDDNDSNGGDRYLANHYHTAQLIGQSVSTLLESRAVHLFIVVVHSSFRL